MSIQLAAAAGLSATVDLSQVTFLLSLPTTPTSGSGNYNAQLFLLRKSDGGYEEVVPRNPDSSPVRIAIFGSGVPNTASFTVTLKPDEYTTGQIVLFAEGTNFMDPNPVSLGVAVDVIVTSTHLRLTKPSMEIQPIIANADGKITVPFVIRYPADAALFNPADANVLPYGGFIVMVKGDVQERGGSPYVWVTTGTQGTAQQFTLTNVDGDSFWQYEGNMVLTPTLGGGVKGVQGGLFNQTWSTDFVWVWPGQAFAVGQWEQLADPAHYPAAAAAFARPATYPALSGNFGNAIASIGTAANDTAAYFGLLSGLGIKSLRVNYSADRYLADELYTQEVDQIAQHMMMAGVVPCLAPQAMPLGAHLADQETALVALGAKVAAKYKGVPVVIDVLNEPSQYATWATWKPVAQRVIDAIKAVDPAALIVVGSEGYSKDMTGASADPLPAGSVMAYGWHPYLAAADLPKMAGSGIPVWAQEYHDGSADFHAALAALPHVIALSAWAWTTPGQDSLNLVQSVDGASLTLTDTGKAIAGFYAAWKAGTPLPPPVITPPPPPPVVGGTGTGTGGTTVSGYTKAEVDALIAAATAAITAQALTDEVADETEAQGEQAGIADLNTQMASLTTQAADQAAAVAAATAQIQAATDQSGGASTTAALAYMQATTALNMINTVKAGIPAQVASITAAARIAAAARMTAKLAGRRPGDNVTVSDMLTLIAAEKG